MAKEEDIAFPKYKTPKRVLFTMNAMLSIIRSRAERKATQFHFFSSSAFTGFLRLNTRYR